MVKSFKVRLYPTKEQEQLMWKHIGSCRFVYNYMLGKQKEYYKAEEKHLSYFDTVKLLTPLKNDAKYSWLYEVSNTSLQRVCKDLDEAYEAFFKKQNGFPKFKSRKKSKLTFPIRAERFYFKNNKILNIEKIGKVKYKSDFTFEFGRDVCKFINPRVSNKNGKWILSFGMECESQARQLNDFSMGIDLGIKETATVAYKDKVLVFYNINKSKKIKTLKKNLKHLQRSISRKYEANKQGKTYIKTNNIIKQENKLRKLYAKISNIRENYIHQTTHKLIELLPKKVIMEDLNVRGMMRNKHLSKAIQEQCFYEFIRQMKYKCEWNGIEFIQVDRFYPSSKTCHNCGHIKQNLKLEDRTYTCIECGYKNDRDINAALNLMSYKD